MSMLRRIVWGLGSLAAACGSGSTDAAGGGGGPGSGDGGPSGMGGGAGVVLPDPAPATPDLTGLVPTSARWVLFTESGGSFIGPNLTLLDVTSATEHEANPGGPPVAYATWSPDGASFLLSGANADTDQNLRVVRLTDHGFVPAAWVQGYSGVRGNIGFFHFSADSRFAVGARGGSQTDGIEIVDVTLGQRIGHDEFPPAFGGEFAPAGYYYSYWQATGMTSGGNYYGRVTKDGTSPRTALPSSGGDIQFDSRGQRLFYETLEGTKNALHYIDLPGAAAKDLVVASAGESFEGSYAVGPDGSVLVYDTRTDGGRTYARVWVDGSHPRLDVSDVAHNVYTVFAAADYSLLVLDYQTSLEVVRPEPLARLPLPGKNLRDAQNYSSVGIAGTHAFYQDAAGLHFAVFGSGSALVDAMVAPAADGAYSCSKYGSTLSHEPATKLTLVSNAGGTLVFLDASAPTVTVVGKLTASVAGATFTCPYWSRGDDAFAVVELAKTGSSKLYLAHWAGGKPDTPVVVRESTQRIEPRAFLYH